MIKALWRFGVTLAAAGLIVDKIFPPTPSIKMAVTVLGGIALAFLLAHVALVIWTEGKETP